MGCFYLIRHAETPLNASRTVQWPETPLSERGSWQATRLAETLRGRRLGRIVTSDYARARATATRLGEATGAPVTVDVRLRERHLGSLRGTPWPASWDRLGDGGVPPDGGESDTTFHARVDDAWTWLRGLVGATAHPVAVISHGLFCAALATRHLSLDAGAGPLRFTNASITVVDAVPPWRVLQLADTAHLTSEETSHAPLRVDRP